MVCKACQDILLRRAELCWPSLPRNKDSFVVHHRNFESLRHAAEVEKCLFCYDLWMQMNPEDRRLAIEYNNTSKHDITRGDYFISLGSVRKDSSASPKSKISRLFSTFQSLPKRSVREDEPWQLNLTLSRKIREKFSGSVLYCRYDLHDRKDLDTTRPVDNLASSSTKLSNTKSTASRWLEQCCANHNACNEDLGRNGWNPTRLLDLRGAFNGKIHLIDQTSTMEPLVYVTLSHRWGQGSFLELTNATETHLKLGFSLAELPQTFQHAIEVTRTLGYHFLWIDSLCIKQDQDDMADWYREASLMHKVYQHGHFNISATGTESSLESLFRDRDSMAAGFTEVDMLADKKGARPTKCIALQTSFWRNNVSETSLNRRGWVVQERILSRRVLHFGAKQLLWECQEFKASESFRHGLPKELDGGNIKNLDPIMYGSTPPGKERPQRYWAHDLWRSIVTSYSECALTKDTDKLLAIMGIAKRVQVLVNDTYVAGMWRRYLVSELGWHATSWTYDRPQAYRAPTWSWASIDAPTWAPFPSDEGPRLSIKDISLEYATKEEFGPLLGGRIHLDGILRPAEICHYAKWPEEEFNFTVLLPTTSAFGAGSDLNNDHWVFFDVKPKTLQDDVKSGSIFCMELHDDVHPVRSTLGVLILRCEDRAAGLYSRMGWMEYSESARMLLLKDRQRVKDLPCVSWNAQTKLHTICVI